MAQRRGIRKHKIFVSLGLILVIFFGVTQLYYAFFSQKANIKKTVLKTKKSLEVGDIRGFLSFLSKDFFDNHGLNHQQVEEGLKELFREFDGIKINVTSQKIRVNGESATDSLGAIVIVKRGGEQGFLLGSFVQPAPVKVNLMKEKGEWKVKRVEW
ncbi:MAG: hypothetical protein AB1393_01380 [Candidatus Edwardsbacteria bacterium]